MADADDRTIDRPQGFVGINVCLVLVESGCCVKHTIDFRDSPDESPPLGSTLLRTVPFCFNEELYRVHKTVSSEVAESDVRGVAQRRTEGAA